VIETKKNSPDTSGGGRYILQAVKIIVAKNNILPATKMQNEIAAPIPRITTGTHKGDVINRNRSFNMVVSFL